MITIARYAKSRHFSMSHGWGKPLVAWLWLDAMVFAISRYCTLRSPWFAAWCRKVDRLFREQHDCVGSMTTQTGRDCWIDAYRDGLSPEDAVDTEVSYWD